MFSVELDFCYWTVTDDLVKKEGLPESSCHISKISFRGVQQCARDPQLLKILYKIVQSSGIFRDCKVVMKDCMP